MIYIATFVTTILLCVIAHRLPRKSLLRKILFIVALILPCVLAGLRDYSIGTDVHVYIQRWFEKACASNSLGNYAEQLGTSDYLYVFLNFAISRFTKDIGVLFFAIEFLCFAPIMYILYKQNNAKVTIIALASYFLYSYNMSFNMARQSISLSFSFLSFYLLTKGKVRSYLLTTWISYLFHFSGIIGLLYLPIIKANHKKNSRYLLYVIYAIIPIIIMNFVPTISSLISAGILPSKYLSYITEYLRDKADINVANELFYGSLLVIQLFISKGKKDTFVLYILGFILFQVGIVSNFAYRVSYAFFIPALYNGIPNAVLLIKDKKNRLFVALMIIAILMVYWVFWIVILGVHQTYPYKLR